MNEKEYGNYSGKALDFLKKEQLPIWSEIKATIDDFSLEGMIAPAPEGTEGVVFFRLDNGYNTAFSLERIHNIEKQGQEEVEYKISPREVTPQSDLPDVHILGAGGTVASKVDYRTGAVKASFSTNEIVTAIPELTDLANIETTLLFNIFSEHMGPKHWKKIAKETATLIQSGVEGVVITHGTDTMHYTSAALSFMLDTLPVPVVLTGSQRSSDRPASDAASNLKAAVKLAGRGNIAEVQVCMHATTSDERFFAHKGTRVRKMHSSRRDTFRSLSDFPIAEVTNSKIKYLQDDFHQRSSSTQEDLKLDASFEEKTALVWIYPNIEPEIIESLIDRGYKGIVLAGTGLGHIPRKLYTTIERGIEEDVLFLMTTQCLNGRVDMNVYETGRDLVNMGVISGKSMLPSVAYVKLGWVLDHDWGMEKTKQRLQENLTGERVIRESPVAFYHQPLPDNTKDLGKE